MGFARAPRAAGGCGGFCFGKVGRNFERLHMFKFVPHSYSLAKRTLANIKTPNNFFRVHIK